MIKQAVIMVGCFVNSGIVQAGDDYSYQGSKEVIRLSEPRLCNWFAGGSAGYVDGNWNEAMYTLHFGYECHRDGSDISDAVFLEIGYTEKDSRWEIHQSASGAFATRPGSGASSFGGSDASIVPLTLNYKYERKLWDKLNWYTGAGAGVAFTDLSIGSTTGSLSFDDVGFYAHLFTGITYNFSDSYELFGGVRYLIMDDPDLTGLPVIDDRITLDGDYFFELGLRYNF